MLALAVGTHKGTVQYTHKSCNNTQEYTYKMLRGSKVMPTKHVCMQRCMHLN